MSGGGGAGPLVPTFHGFVQNSMDGLVLFEACLSGKLHHVPRRPHDRERSSLIKSGSVFIYEENASGIKRWTDGVAWSPSRILGNFLIYRELEKPFPPGEKKRAMKRKRTSLPGDPYPRRDSDDTDADQVTPISPTQTNSGDVKSSASSELPSSDQDKELERALIGSLVDSYGFRPEGLVKKTMSISINGISHHMVSYYKVDDVKNHTLPRPTEDARLHGIVVRPELYLKQNFRSPVEETEHYAIDGQMHAHPQMMYQMQGNSPYGVRPGQYFGAQQYGGVYGIPSSAASPYGSVSGTAWPAQQASAGASAPAYGSQQQYADQGFSGGYYKSATPTNVKSEGPGSNSSSTPYGGQYPAPYPPMQRNDSTPNMGGSAYQTPVNPQSSTFGSMSARPSYSSTTMPSPTANGPAPAGYGSATPQQYPVRSPSQSYGIQSAPNSAVAQSPHPDLRSPNSAAPASAPAAEMSYRSASYSGLGISNTAEYPSQPPPNSTYSAYATPGQAYRSGEMPTAPAGGQYAQ